MVNKATLFGTLSDSLVLIAMIALYTFIITMAVLAVDVVALWLLNLLTDLNTWLNLLFFEGVVMAIFGAAGWWWGDRPYPFGTPMGKRLYKVKIGYRYTLPWVSLGMAGFVLVILSGYLASQYY